MWVKLQRGNFPRKQKNFSPNMKIVLVPVRGFPLVATYLALQLLYWQQRRHRVAARTGHPAQHVRLEPHRAPGRTGGWQGSWAVERLEELGLNVG
jgi:hypothetical protein